MDITPVTTHDLKALGGFAYATHPATRIATAINALITAVETPSVATAPRIDSMIPTPALLAGFDMAASGVLKLAANCIISRVTVYPLAPWTVGAGETSAWALVNATTGKSLATKTFADAPPASGTPVDFTLNATAADLICSAGDVLTLAVTNSAAAAVAAAHLQIVGA